MMGDPASPSRAHERSPLDAVSALRVSPAIAEAAELALTVARARCMSFLNCAAFLPHHKRCEKCPQTVGEEIANALLYDMDWWLSRHRFDAEGKVRE